MFKFLLVFVVIGLLIFPVYAQSLPPLPDLAVISPENADQLVEVARIGNGQVITAAWSPDGNRFAVASTIGVWLVDSLDAEPHVLPDQRGMAGDVVFSPDGRFLASGDENGVVYLWDGITGELLNSYSNESGAIVEVVFSPDGTLLAGGDYGGSLNVWNIETNKHLFYRQVDEGGVFNSIIFTPDGHYVAWGMIYPADVAPLFSSWWLGDLQTGQLLPLPEWYNQLPPQSIGYSTSICISSDSKVFISGNSLYDFWTGNVVDEPSEMSCLNDDIYGEIIFHGNNDLLLSIPYSNDQVLLYEYIGGEGRDDILATYDVWTPTILQLITRPVYDANHIIVPNEYYLLIAYQYGGIEVWHITPDGISKFWTGSVPFNFTAVDFVVRNDEIHIVTGDSYGQVWYSHADYGFRSTGHQGIVTQVALIEDLVIGKLMIISSGEDGTLRLWKEPATEYQNEILVQAQIPIQDFYYAADQQHIINSASQSFFTYSMQSAQNSVLYRLGVSDNTVIISHDRSMLAFGGAYHESLTLWDTLSDEQIAILWENPSYFIDDVLYALAFSSDDRLLVATFGNCWEIGCVLDSFGVVRLWNVETQRQITTLYGHKNSVTSVAFSPDGKHLITGSWDGTVRFWGVPASE